jgi:hypothetical protein
LPTRRCRPRAFQRIGRFEVSTAESAPPPEDRGSGTAFGSSPKAKGSSAPSPVGLARTCQQSAGRRQQNSPSTIDTLSTYRSLRRPATRARWGRSCLWLTLDLGLRIAPLAIMGSVVRSGTRQDIPRTRLARVWVLLLVATFRRR